MMKRLKLIIFIFMIVSFICPVDAYEFQNSSVESSVKLEREDIYSMKKTYDELIGDSDEEEIVYEEVSNSFYWWPIGSDKTTTVNGKTYALGDPVDTTITSFFGYRSAVINSSGKKITSDGNHGGIDIAAGQGVGVTNVIAVKSGVVVYPSAKSKLDCKNSDKSCSSYGNYVVIQHSDGNYTLYGHLHENSITVKEGDTVEQGQVIAKVGNSGNSTGPHLHFEIRVGENKTDSRDNPLDYVDKDIPRSNNSSSSSLSFDELVEYVYSWEGTTASTDTEYIAENGGDGVITIGHGVTWEGTSNLFRKYGITEMYVGTRVSKKIVDQVGIDALLLAVDDIKADLSANGIDDLKEYQIFALASQVYNGGYTVIKDSSYGYDFISAYLKHKGKYKFDDIYKHESNIWYDSMCRPYGPGTEWQLGLQRRRVSEWRLFTTGEIDFYPLSTFDPSKYAWPE